MRRAIPFKIHTPLLTRSLILDPLRNGFSEQTLGNFVFFSLALRKFTIFHKHLRNSNNFLTLLDPFLTLSEKKPVQGSREFFPLQKFPFLSRPSETSLLFSDPFRKKNPFRVTANFYPLPKFSIFITPRKFLHFFNPFGNHLDFSYPPPKNAM